MTIAGYFTLVSTSIRKSCNSYEIALFSENNKEVVEESMPLLYCCNIADTA